MPRTADPRTLDALLEATRAEFARHGPEQARVEDIARRAGVSKGAFYLHFRSKEHAFELILQRFLGALEEHARRRQDAERAVAPGPEAFEREVRWDADLLELLWQNRQILAAVDGAGGRSWSRHVGAFRNRMRALVAARLGERQAGGTMRRDLDPSVVADLVLGAYEDAGRRLVEMRKPPDFAAWSRTILTVLYEGMMDRSRAPLADQPVSDTRSRR
jgi:AcrR family transcriptional regulator